MLERNQEFKLLNFPMKIYSSITPRKDANLLQFLNVSGHSTQRPKIASCTIKGLFLIAKAAFTIPTVFQRENILPS